MRSQKHILIYLGQIIGLATLYFFGAKFGLSVHAYNTFATLLWPPTGISIATLLVLGTRLWPGVLIGAFLANIDAGAPLWVAYAIAVGNTLEAVIGAMICNKRIRAEPSSWNLDSSMDSFHNTLDRLSDVVRLVLGAALLSTCISATFGSTALLLSGLISKHHLGTTWLQWWVGDVMSALTITPLLLVFSARLQIERFEFDLRTLMNKQITSFLLIGIGLVYLSKVFNFDFIPLAGAYLLLPLLLWTSIRFGQRGAVVSIFIISVVTIWSTANGLGPFVEEDFTSNLVHLLTFVMVVSCTGLIVAAVVTEREKERENLEKSIAERAIIEEILKRSHDNLEKIVEERTSELRKSEERSRLIIGSVEEYAIFMLDPDGTISTWNTGAERIHGYKAYEIIGKNFSVLRPTNEDLATGSESELLEAQKKGKYEEEGLRLRKDGSTFYASVIMTPLYDRQGQLTGFSKVIRDITERKRAESELHLLNQQLEQRVNDRTLELQRRERQLRAIANAMPILIGQIDRDERFLFANEPLAKWFEKEPAELVGKTYREVIGPERYEISSGPLAQAMAGKLITFEREGVRDGKNFSLALTFVPEFDTDGAVTSCILVATDISKYKEIEFELKVAMEAAESANAAKSAFLANMSHEIRTPLGAVLGFSELVLNSSISSAEKEACVDAIKRNGRLLSNIINDILDLSKVEAGKLDIEKVDVSLDEVLTDVTSILNLEATEKGIHLTWFTAGEVPSYVKTDPLRLRQILMNIVGNAIKFTDRGYVDVKVKLLPNEEHASNSSGVLAFEVKDSGHGMTSAQAKKLFEPFSQADISTTRKFGGTGLGLALSKRLAAALGGDVVLTTSSPGEGSTFTITIDPGPAIQLPSRALLKAVPKKRTDNFKNINVLLVDDSPDNQVLVSHLLRLVGTTVKTANNGREGVEMARAGNYDIVLMDLQMPEMDGYSATRLLRNEGYSKPIIALTAHALKEERKKCLASGFNGHLSKPIDHKVLLETIDSFASQGS